MPFKAMAQNSSQIGPMATLSIGASLVQRSIERRFSLASNKSGKSSPTDRSEAVESQDVEAVEEDRTPGFDLADDLEAGFAADAFMTKSSMSQSMSPAQPEDPFRRCCIFHVTDSADEFHLLSETGDLLLTAKYIRSAARIEFFCSEEDAKSPASLRKHKPAFIMTFNSDRGNWFLRQTDCEHCMHRPKHFSCEALGQGSQVAFIQHCLRPVGRARVNYVDIRIPPVTSGSDHTVWCPVNMGRDLCGRTSCNSSGYSRYRRNSAPEILSHEECDSPKRYHSEPEGTNSDVGSQSPPRSPNSRRFDLDVQPLLLHTKVPEWDDELESLVLNFKDRTVQSSPMNFMLRTADNDSIIMQHAKMAANTFGLDYRYPLSTVQAFAVALTALAWD